MTYRLAEEADFPRVEEFCSKHNLPKPILMVCFIAETDAGEIVAYANGGWVGFIESFGTDDPMAGHTLYAMLEGALKASKISPVFAGVINPKAGEMLARLGYDEVTDTKFYLKRK